MQITHKNILSYTLLPQLAPRFKDLFGSGFQYIPYFIALVYGAVRLLPENHPYLNAQNVGQFGIRHVIAQAANNLTLSKNNLDQILLFIVTLFGLVMAVIQIVLLGLALMIQPVMAGTMPTNFGEFFLVGNPQDLAFIMLDMVFGVPGVGDAQSFFGSCVPTGTCTDMNGQVINGAITIGEGPDATTFQPNWSYQPTSFPFPIHEGLHQLFQIYSLGLLVVGAFITIYFMIAVVAETAQTGTPFGKRFNKVWAPIRIVVAFGLLMPLTAGLNGSQYLVLYAAKFGTGFANAGWNIFLNDLTTVHGINTESLVAAPNIPQIGSFVQFLFTAKTCKEALDALETTKDNPKAEIIPYIVGDPTAAPPNLPIGGSTMYENVMSHVNGQANIVVRFGRYDLDDAGTAAGFVNPICGEFMIPLQVVSTPDFSGTDPYLGIHQMQEFYWFTFIDFWFNIFDGVALPGIEGTGVNYADHIAQLYISSHPRHNTVVSKPDETFRNAVNTAMDTYIRDDMEVALEMLQNSGYWDIDTNIRDKGWACAACLYNRIAGMNGTFISAVMNVPIPTKYPKIMESIYEQKKKNDANLIFSERFKPNITGSSMAFAEAPEDAQTAVALWNAFDFWQHGGTKTSTNNIIIDTINELIGTDGLFDMRENANIHPLAQLSAVGKSLVEASIRNLSYAAIGGGSGILLKSMEGFAGTAASTASGFLITFGMISLTAGFVLYYVVPFLPFIFFFFSFGGWVKGIFEAMVGAPLWALAHIRIDNAGLPGQAALSGYFLIFEVFLRPILMVFGLLASISIFSALVKVLNMIFERVVTNLTGFNVSGEITTGGGLGSAQLAYIRGGVDEFFFTVVYVVIVYMMGMSSFKLIDLIPNNILRWIGQTVATFGDQKDDPTQKLVGTATVGTQQLSGALSGGLKNIVALGK